jgi:hypothetical protein
MLLVFESSKQRNGGTASGCIRDRSVVHISPSVRRSTFPTCDVILTVKKIRHVNRECVIIIDDQHDDEASRA